MDSPTGSISSTRSASTAFFLTDEAQRIIAVEGPLPLLLGYGHAVKPETLYGQPLTEVVMELHGFQESLAAILRGEEESLILRWLNRQRAEPSPAGSQDGLDSLVDYVNLSVLPWRLGEEQRQGLLCMATDVTQEARAKQMIMQHENEVGLLREQLFHKQSELNAINLELQMAKESRTAFCSLAAHKLRNPLATIYGYLEILAEEDLGDLPPHQTASLRMIHQQTQVMVRSLADLLDAVRIDADRIELILQPTPVQNLADEIESLADLFLSPKNQRLSMEAPVGLPDVLCDSRRVQQMVSHLLQIAGNLSPEGAEIHIGFDAIREQADLQVAITLPTPSLLPLAQMQHLALIGPHESNLFPNQPQDTNIGVYIAESLVELHGGEIWQEVDSHRSAIYFTLPLAIPVPLP